MRRVVALNLTLAVSAALSVSTAMTMWTAAATNGIRDVANADATQSAPEGDYRFDVFGDGTHLGVHRVTVRQEDGQIRVEVRIDLRWRLAYITFFRYAHRNRLIWEQGKLVSMQAWTNDNGTRHEVRVRRDADGLVLSGTGDSGRLPDDILPTTYWQQETVTRTQMLDTQSGRLVDYRVEPLGRSTVSAGDGEVESDGFDLSGDLNARLFYQPDGTWIGMRFRYDDTEITYRPHAASVTE